MPLFNATRSTTPAYSRSRFAEIIAVVLVIDIALSLLMALSFGTSLLATAMVFALSLLGPFCYLLMFSVGPISILYITGTTLMLFSYIIKPADGTSSVSVFGAIIWAVSGFAITLLGNSPV